MLVPGAAVWVAVAVMAGVWVAVAVAVVETIGVDVGVFVLVGGVPVTVAVTVSV